MASVMAIVSKAVFEKAARGLAEGDVWATDHYASANKALAPLGDGGNLYLVTVRPGEVLWLVGVLESPEQTEDGWGGVANTRPIRAIDDLRSRISFESGVGITAKAGALGMSLQTPRVLSDADVALLDGDAKPKLAAKPKPAAKPLPAAKPATKPLPAAKLPAKPVPAVKTAAKSVPAKTAAKPVPAAKPPAKPVPAAKTAAKSVPAKTAAKPVPAAEPATKLVPAAKTAAKQTRSGATIADALGQARDEDWAGALATLLAVWRDAPNPALAEMICAIGAIQPVDQIDIGSWPALGKTQRPEHLDGLLAVIFDKGSVKARDFIVTLDAWKPDPRIDRWVANLFAKPVFSSTGARPMWTRIQPLLKRIVDQTAIAQIEAARPRWRHEWEFLAEYVDRAKLSAQPAAAVDRDALAAIQKLLGAATETPAEAKRADSLLAAYLAAPNPDALPVLADALIEAGDPRGEVINTQLAGKKADKLIARHLDHLLGKLAGVVQGPVFTNGFLSACRMRDSKASKTRLAIKESVGDLLWATVERIEDGDWDVLHSPVCRNVKALINCNVDLPFAAKLPKLETLFQQRVDDKKLAVLTGDGFAALLHLTVMIERRFAVPLVESALARRLETLVVHPTLANLQWLAPELQTQTVADDRALFQAFVAAATTLPGTTTLVLDRDAGASVALEIGDAITVSFQTKTAAAEAFAVTDAIGALGGRGKKPVVVKAPPTDPKHKKALERALS